MRFLGVYKDLLWVQLNGFRLLAINIQTGRKEVYIETPIGYNDYFLNTNSGIIQVLSGYIYSEFCLNDLKLKKRLELDRVFSIWKCNYSESEKKVYFCAYYGLLKNPNCFGIFDTEKCQIVWYKLSENGEIYFNPPQTNDSQLGILDDKGTLNIYEKYQI